MKKLKRFASYSYDDIMASPDLYMLFFLGKMRVAQPIKTTTGFMGR
jgi:hypothetical protein